MMIGLARMMNPGLSMMIQPLRMTIPVLRVTIDPRVTISPRMTIQPLRVTIPALRVTIRPHSRPEPLAHTKKDPAHGRIFSFH